MFRSIFRTAGQHIARTRFVTGLVTFGFMVLFLTVLAGIAMVELLSAQRNILTEKFTYPLFISNLSTFESPRVRSFVAGLNEVGIQEDIVYVTKEQALDTEVQRNPNILSVLGGQNPLPDMMLIPLYGTDITLLWDHIQEYRDIFDAVQSFELLRARLKKFENSMAEIDHIVDMLAVFLALTGLLMVVLVFVMIRYQARYFWHERVVGRLVGAHPVFFWAPHGITLIACALLGYSIAYFLFGFVTSGML